MKIWGLEPEAELPSHRAVLAGHWQVEKRLQLDTGGRILEKLGVHSVMAHLFLTGSLQA